MELYANHLFELYQRGATVPDLSVTTGLPEAEVEGYIREKAWEILEHGQDRLFPLPSTRLETFPIQWDLIWDS